ncbi:hypothetical protein M3Y99_01148700 [Aphelenchoides fujianensis]|nr:hypothetical protein M3Y99_01148700 [Aphelenchoides fujianensis]
MFALTMPLNRLFSARLMLVCIVVLFCLLSIAPPAQAMSYKEFEEEDKLEKLEKDCPIEEKNAALFSIMDKVCELCHDMYSHSNPNMMNQCRSGCFRSSHFKKCLHLFSPTRSLRHVLRRH